MSEKRKDSTSRLFKHLAPPVAKQQFKMKGFQQKKNKSFFLFVKEDMRREGSRFYLRVELTGLQLH